MKNKYIIQLTLCLSLLCVAMISCEDEVLVPTEDTTTADALLAEIDNISNQYVTLSAENSTLTISNNELDRALDSLWEVRNELLNAYSQPTKVELTLNLLSVAKTIFSGGRTAGLEGATVIVEQNELVLQADASSTAGLYLFKGLRAGEARIRVTAPNHSSVDARIWLYINNGQDVAGADTYNAATTLVLYPVSGELAATLKGTAYANTSTLNDTIDNWYGSNVAFGAKANTPIAVGSNFNFTNNTTTTASRTNYNLYNFSPWGTEVQFETAPAGQKIYAYPSLSGTYINNDGSANGYLTELIYKGVVTSTTVAADGSFSLSVPAASSYSDFTFFGGIDLVSEPFFASHKRFTIGTNYAGENNEAGSASENFSFYNNGNFATAAYTGTGVTTVAVDPAKKAAVTRRTISETWQYNPYFTDGTGSNDASLDDMPASGATVVRNIYFFPRVKQ